MSRAHPKPRQAPPRTAQGQAKPRGSTPREPRPHATAAPSAEARRAAKKAPPSGGKGLALWALGWLDRYRYLKFGIVGASGTVVNLVVLHLGHEYLFAELERGYNRPYFSLALAISLATLNNFCWNRLWTWSDRVKQLEANEVPRVSLHTLGMELGQYITASAFGSGLQYVLTLLLMHSMDYRLANVVAILAASVSNFLANDRWTFRRKP